MCRRGRAQAIGQLQRALDLIAWWIECTCHGLNFSDPPVTACLLVLLMSCDLFNERKYPY